MTRIITLSALSCLFIAGTSYGQDKYNDKAIAANPGPVVQEMIIDTDNRGTMQEINFGGLCYWYNQDVDVDFGIPDIPGYTMVSADITLEYYDADFLDQSVWTAELDVVGIGGYAIDVLKGKNGTQETESWNVLCHIQCNPQSDFLSFQINIDAAHDYNYWCLGLHNVTLTTVWTNIGIVPQCICSNSLSDDLRITK